MFASRSWYLKTGESRTKCTQQATINTCVINKMSNIKQKPKQNKTLKLKNVYRAMSQKSQHRFPVRCWAKNGHLTIIQYCMTE